MACIETTLTIFGTQVLQVNSVISTSLTIEYRIHDILFNKDLLNESVKKDVEQPNFFYTYVIETLEKLKQQQQEYIQLKVLQNKEKH